jgi:hypothetical protein
MRWRRFKLWLHCFIWRHTAEEFVIQTEMFKTEVVYLKCDTCHKVYYKDEVIINKVLRLYGEDLL